LGAYSIPSETGLLIPSVFDNWSNLDQAPTNSRRTYQFRGSA
jgi:hypothetical protein